MGYGVIALVASVALGGAFGSASATVESISDEAMVVTIEVEVLDSADSVVAHLSFDDEELTLPLLDRGERTFGLRTELAPKNYIVVFETIGDDGQTSEATTLARMGADLGTEGVIATSTPANDEGISEQSRRLLWLAVALGAASLSLVAFWVLGGREGTGEEGPAEGDEVDSPEADDETGERIAEEE